MKKENINKDLSAAVSALLQMAREASFNDISDNCFYIITEIKHCNNNFFEQTKLRKAGNDKKTPKSFDAIVTDLEKIYPNLYDVNLYVYKAGKQSTIIEIQYFPRTSHEIAYQKKTTTQETMLHSKITLPSYASDTKEKFDINWEHGTINHKWKMFWWRRKIKKQLKSQRI